MGIGPKVIYQTLAAPVPVAVVRAAPAPAPAVAPVVAPTPAAPAAATYYKADDDGELDRLDVAYVSYGAAAPRAAVAAAPAPLRLAPAPAPIVPSVQVYSLANPSAGPLLLPIDLD